MSSAASSEQYPADEIRSGPIPTSSAKKLSRLSAGPAESHSSSRRGVLHLANRPIASTPLPLSVDRHKEYHRVMCALNKIALPSLAIALTLIGGCQPAGPLVRAGIALIAARVVAAGRANGEPGSRRAAGGLGRAGRLVAGALPHAARARRIGRT